MNKEIFIDLIRNLYEVYDQTGEFLTLEYIRDMEDDPYCVIYGVDTKKLSDNEIRLCITKVKELI